MRSPSHPRLTAPEPVSRLRRVSRLPWGEEQLREPGGVRLGLAQGPGVAVDRRLALGEPGGDLPDGPPLPEGGLDRREPGVVAQRVGAGHRSAPLRGRTGHALGSVAAPPAAADPEAVPPARARAPPDPPREVGRRQEPPRPGLGVVDVPVALDVGDSAPPPPPTRGRRRAGAGSRPPGRPRRPCSCVRLDDVLEGREQLPLVDGQLPAEAVPAPAPHPETAAGPRCARVRPEAGVLVHLDAQQVQGRRSRRRGRSAPPRGRAPAPPPRPPRRAGRRGRGRPQRGAAGSWASPPPAAGRATSGRRVLRGWAGAGGARPRSGRRWPPPGRAPRGGSAPCRPPWPPAPRPPPPGPRPRRTRPPARRAPAAPAPRRGSARGWPTAPPGRP